ncbi:hypothetical protein C8R46DRAFT_274686 [Mycena filopes]|nr:hypothetical protein C8R46DRAFT_274686 [Mycena filopes]
MARDCVLLPLAKAVLPASVYNIVEAVLSLDIKAIYKFFSAAVKIIVAILSEKGYTPSGEVTWDTNVTKPMELTEEFGYAYNLLTIHPTEQSSEDGKSVLGSLRLACVGCRADGYLKHRSKVRFTFSKGFTDAEVEIVDGHMDYSAGIGIVFELDFKGDIFKQNVVKVPLSPLAIPGIIIIGPYLSLDCGLGYDIGAKGTAVARNNIGWSNMTAKLDMVHGDKSFIGKWIETEPVPLISIEVEGHATLDPYVSGGIYFGIDVLNGKFTISAGLEAKVSLPVTLKTAITSDGNDVSFKGCKGIDASLSAKVEWYLVLEAGKYQQHYAPDQVPHEKEWPIYSECIGLPEAKTKNQLGQDVPVPTLPPPRPDEVYRTITAHFPDGNLDVVWLNGNLFAITPQDPNTAQFTANRYFIGLKSLSATNATVGSYDNGVFVAYYKDIRTYGVSRFELAYQDKIPKDAVVVGLRSETGKNGEPAFLTAVTTITSERWYLLLCLFKDRSLPPKIVIARNPEEGARTMEYNNNNKANTNYFAGKPVLSCKFSKFTIS